MSTRTAGRLAWSLGYLSVALAAGALVFLVLTRSADFEDAGTRSADVLFTFSFLAFALVGALVASRRPQNPIGWLFLVAGLAWEVSSFSDGYAVYALLAHPDSLPGGTAMAWLQAWASVPSIVLASTFIVLLFPGGRLLSRRWRPVAWVAALSGALLLLGFALPAGPLNRFDSVPNPVGVEAASFLIDANPAWGLLPLSALASAVSLGLRFRRSKGEERQQLKWFSSAAALVAAALAAAILSSDSEPSKTITEIVLAVVCATLPLAAGVAILRHRLYDIDLIIRRTLVYGVATGALAGLYFAIVLLLQAIFSSFAGGSDLAIAGSTLAVAALFRPARRRIQALVDRRFYRRRYDAQRTLEAFAGRLRDEINLDSLGADLRSVVDNTMQPAHVSLWLRAPVTPVVTISGRSPSTKELR